MIFSKTTQDLLNSKPERRGTEADRWGLLTDGTHATERQEAETSSSLANLDNGGVFGETEGIYAFLSSRRTR
jgi:hypothetical protein